MRPYLTYIFISLAMIGLVFIYSIDAIWSGIIASLLACVSLSFALYYSRYMK